MSLHNSNSNLDPQVSPGLNPQSQMGLPEVLQMCCQSRRSGQITYRSGESYGFIFIQHGLVLHAMCGPLEGEDAVYTMLTWPGGTYTLNEDILPHKKTINLSWEQLLFEGARRTDAGTIQARPTSSLPVTTAEPAINNRPQDSQPKLTITRPELPPSTYELVHEFTHVGRSSGNEISLPYPSVSNRHCIFIMSGPDIVLRDLNSSNGTLVNDAAINEVVLRPGDLLQMGVVLMKFETGIKRPKLLPSTLNPRKGTGPLEMGDAVRPLVHETVKLPSRAAIKAAAAGQTKTDSSYFKGETAISYEHLAKPVEEKKSHLPVVLFLVIGIVLLGTAAYFFFMAQ